ncbi:MULTISPECIES: hypothetical protein [unclassified Pseudomonas]|uniref:hypothetical protein n=1 Tax=unclassified Pseudomonas TaxID=196821 RepID=UPI002448C0C2|nr:MULTISPECIES: hypothetical protein [unclassified Pseudomonas]MDG9926541.1 hypothetical protein [Pseudomonas sp. GD04042]MDH0481375.1 hypothetical protein [Pseudomonas sp. GD04015]MDH0603324.1 hypothetical protein [Pseudomonas sp. GD03869]
MGAAIDFLRERGLTAKVNGQRLVVSPASKLTPDVRKYIKAHRLELLAELAANDGQERRSHWRVSRNNKPLCTMIGEPMTYAEALEAARWRWPDADVERG